ncbi:hypothetical protein, partial [Robbsia andropogonis]|uniref:hypothetical protein n=1 Tax=Robbsia andropogonis TaxID=28092 RepID=UPI000B31B7B6
LLLAKRRPSVDDSRYVARVRLSFESDGGSNVSRVCDHALRDAPDPVRKRPAQQKLLALLDIDAWSL